MSIIGVRREGLRRTVFVLVPLRVFALCCLALLGASGYFVISARYDYAAHFVAGAGGGLILLAVFTSAAAVLRVRRSLEPKTADLPVVLATLTAIGAGIGVEYFLFGDPSADLLDIVHQSLGAAFVGLIWTLAPAVPGSVGRVLARASGLVVLGLVMIAMGAKFVSLF